VIADTNADAGTTFADLDAFLALPRVAGLRLAPDGGRLVVGMQTLNREGNRFISGLWEVDPTGERPARRLTRSTAGESLGAFTADGSLLFVSKRPEPDADKDAQEEPALWLLPADGGDARLLARLPGGAQNVVVAGDGGQVVLGSTMMPSALDPASDRDIRKQRKDAKVTAILHEQYPVRYWDHDLGPDMTRLLVADSVTDDTPTFRDITGHTGAAMFADAEWDVSPDGRTVVATWYVPEGHGSWRNALVAIDVATGERRVLADQPGIQYGTPRVSPDGTRVAMTVNRLPTLQVCDEVWLATVPLAGGDVTDLTADWDRWPHDFRWTPDGTALVVGADELGHAPLWRVDATTGEAVRLTESGSFTDIQVAPDGRYVYAMRSAVDATPTPMRIALTGDVPDVTALRGPAEPVTVPGRLTEVVTTAADGTSVRGWLALPHDAGPDNPVPLLLFVHGGPLGSWNAWTWRWNPWPAVTRGYAVLMPDPALSTGYGTQFVQRGWRGWGDVPFTDLMSITDATVARDDIDAERTAAMGGSFGGYMANWIAGHTKRFRAIVTHASLWSLDQMGKTTDAAFYWARELDPALEADNSPDHAVDDITTPMLIIHGAKDYRVPLSEAIRMWWDLQSRSADVESPHKFLYFPDENHWILTPGPIKVWYATVFAFLAHHVLGKDWERPTMLG